MPTKSEPAPIFDQDAEAAHAEPPLAPIQLDKPVPPMANTEFAYQPPAQFADPMLALLSRAVEKGFDADQLGKLLDMQERVAKAKAEAAFWAAFNRAQGRMPAIFRSKKGQHNSYAPFEELNAVIKPIYTAEGFSMTFDEETGAREGFVRLVCDVGHTEGHVKRYRGDYPVDGEGAKGGRAGMNAIQGHASTHSYAKRYLAKDIWNIAETNEDNDGAGGCINEDQVRAINEAIEAIASAGGTVDFKRFLKWLQVDNLEQVPVTRFELALSELKAKLKAVQK